MEEAQAFLSLATLPVQCGVHLNGIERAVSRRTPSIATAATAGATFQPATFQVSARIDNVSGVQLPVFEPVLLSNSRGGAADGGAPGKLFELAALGRGSLQVQKTREAFVKALNVLIELASLQVRLPLTLQHVVV